MEMFGRVLKRYSMGRTVGREGARRRIRVANHVESRLGRLKSGRNWLTIVGNEVMEKQLPLREPDLRNSRKWKVCERGKLSFWGRGGGEKSFRGTDSTINFDYLREV